MPDLVQTVTHPETIDAQGEVISEEVTLKGVRYTELISVLIQATKEQQEIIEEQDERMEELEEELEELFEFMEECCSVQDDHDLLSGAADNPGTLPQGFSGEAQIKNIYPNPFSSETTIELLLSSETNVLLEVYDSNGTIVARIVNAVLPAGSTSFKWMPTQLATGTYFVSLKVDDVEFSRQLIKMD